MGIYKDNLVKDLTVDEARLIKHPCIYFIKDVQGNVVYIGKTKNPKKRFEIYKYKISHNRVMNTWLQENNPIFDLLICEESELNKLEISYIHQYKDTNIFNKIAGGEYPWLLDEELPWSAGHVKTPSAIVLTHLRNRNYNKEDLDKVRKTISKMNHKERCCFEVSIAKDNYEHLSFHNHMEKWLSIVEPKLTKFLMEAK